jgi:nucleolar protein 53
MLTTTLKIYIFDHQAPESLLPSRKIDRAAVELPHAGLSYNPSYEAHQALLRAAHEVETRREAEGNAWREKKEQMEAMKRVKESDDGAATALFNGMVIDVPEDNEDAGLADQSTDAAIIVAKKAPARKTRQQKLKAARLHSEVSSLPRL